jgi:hypothetical protein
MTTVVMTGLDGHARSQHPDRRHVVGGSRTPDLSCMALAAGHTMAFPALLHGAAVRTGDQRGTITRSAATDRTSRVLGART